MEPLYYRLLRSSLRLFFKHLYTTCAWAYDFVAWTTSMGQWRTWQSAAMEALPDGNLLEIGHGPGHILLKLAQNKRRVLGVDSSTQMARIAAQRLLRNGYQPNIIRSLTQRLPLPSEHFSCVLSIFPSEYLYQPNTLSEVWRVLQPNGLFVIVAVVKITGMSIPDRFAAWLYRITGQSGELVGDWVEPLERQGFSTRLEQVQQPRAVVLRVVSRKITS